MTLSVNAFSRPKTRFSAPSVLSVLDLVLITQNLRVISVFSAPPRLGTRSPGRRHDSPLPPFSQLLTGLDHSKSPRDLRFLRASAFRDAARPADGTILRSLRSLNS